MRPKERIIPYLDLLKGKTIMFSELIKNDESFDDLSDDEIVIGNNIYQELKKVWLKNPDWRLMQLFVNTGLIPNFAGTWYYIEDLDIMLNLGFDPRDVMLWGTYGKNGDKPLKYVFFKEMSDDHIKSVLANVKSISDRHKKAFEDELEYRKRNNFEINDY